MKNNLPAILIVIVALGAYFAADRLNAPVHVLPVTYSVKPKLVQAKEMVEKASILVIGDRHAKKLEKFKEQLEKQVVSRSIQNFKIINIADEGDGLHRTFRKIKSLKNLPKIVIYMGGSEEFFEKRYRLRDRKKIYENFKVYKNTIKITAIMLAPYLSKFLYTPTKFYVLPDVPIRDEQIYTGIESQVRLELGIKFFQLEFQEMVKYINEKGSSLVVLTVPLKRDTKPFKICDNANTEEIEMFQNKMENNLDLNKHIESIPLLEELAAKTVANSRSYYLLGRAYMAAGKFKEANMAYTKSHAFDCDPQNGHIAFNEMIRKIYKQNQSFKLIDFDKQLNNYFGKESVFYSDIYPQDIQYEKIIDQLARYSKETLNL